MAIFSAEDEAAVRDLLAKVERPVELALVLGPEEEPVAGAREIDFSTETRRVCEELAALSDKLSLTVHDAPALGAERFPAIAVLPEGEDVGIRYFGLPWGYELGSLIGACLDAGHRESSLAPESVERLATLERDLALEVFVTPT